GLSVLFEPDIGRSHDLAPLLGVAREQLAELGRREHERRAAELADPGLELGISEAAIDLRVEPFDDLGRRIPGRADAEPDARLVAGQELTDAGYIWEKRRAPRRGHRQRPKLSGRDVLDERKHALEHDLRPPAEQIGERG